MKIAIIFVSSSLIASGVSQAQPSIIWETLWADYFYDVHETSTGGFIAAGRNVGTPFDDECLFSFTSEGNYQWQYGDPSLYYQEGKWVEETQDGGFIVTGRCKITQTSTYALFLHRVDSTGNLLWSSIYDIDNSDEYGYCVLPLPDGGFFVCGEKDPDTGMDQAWMLRTDSNGDTLWTREWGWDFSDQARRILYIDDGLTVLMHGRLQTTSYGPHLVHYDLDGNLLWETPIPDMYGDHGQDFCLASDSGYVVSTISDVWIAHADSLGETQWIMNPMGLGTDYGYSLNPTMDGGYVYAGQNEVFEPGEQTYSGMIGKLDSEGNQQWWDFVYESNCDGFFSARQLSQGGYIAAGVAGGQGYLIRYEPEVGIGEEGEVQSTVQLVISPSPFSSSLTISYSLPESRNVNLSAYDLSGRLVENLVNASISAGENTSVWNPEPSLSSGCYLIVLDACGERFVRRCVKL